MVKRTDLKQRAIYVYFLAEVAERWKTLADQSGTSISKFVTEHMEDFLNMETDPICQPRTSLLDDKRKLLEALKEKEKRVHDLELLAGDAS